MNSIPIKRIFDKLDEYFGRKDFSAAEKHLLYWLSEAETAGNKESQCLILNELAGFYRKIAEKEKALAAAEKLLELSDGITIADATSFINCATVFKAFGKAEQSLPLFQKAKVIYENKLSHDDGRLGGLYNNMALTLVDLERYEEAYSLYEKAVHVMQKVKNGALEVAITYLNIASAKEKELGGFESDEIVRNCLDTARRLLDNHRNRDSYYAFVCEKCSGVFGYYGYFLYEKELNERAREIYERS